MDRVTRNIESQARKAGCEPVSHKGSHEKWECPDGGKFGLVKNSKRTKEQSPAISKKAHEVIQRNLNEHP